MYRDLSPFWTWANRLSLGGAWLAVGSVGALSLALPPVTISSMMPGWVSWVWATFTILGSVGGLLGSFRGDHWMESVGAWLAGAGMVTYAITVWSLVVLGEVTRSSQASALSALVLFVVSRAVAGGSHAYRLRRLHDSVSER